MFTVTTEPFMSGGDRGSYVLIRDADGRDVLAIAFVADDSPDHIAEHVAGRLTKLAKILADDTYGWGE